MPMRLVGVVPCRYGSSRFPGKALADLGGRPLMWWPHRAARDSGAFERVVVATDDERIVAACEQHDIEAVMTSAEHRTGTDRVAEVAERIPADGYVNVQGDEQLLDPDAIRRLAGALRAAPPETTAVGAHAPIGSTRDVLDPNVVKALLDTRGGVLAYTRAPAPHPKRGAASWLRQLGVYGMRADTLARFARTAPGPLEAAEEVEMLRLLEHGERIVSIELPGDHLGVDTPADLERARALVEREPAVRP